MPPQVSTNGSAGELRVASAPGPRASCRSTRASGFGSSTRSRSNGDSRVERPARGRRERAEEIAADPQPQRIRARPECRQVLEGLAEARRDHRMQRRVRRARPCSRRRRGAGSRPRATRPVLRAIAGRAAVRATELSTGSCGTRMPSDPQKSRVQAPAAQTTARVATRPCSVTTPETRPAAVSMPRTAVRLRTRAPRAPRAAGDRARGARGFGAPVARRVQRARPARRRGEHAVEFATDEEARVERVLARDRRAIRRARRVAPRSPRDRASRPGGSRRPRRAATGNAFHRPQALDHERQFDRRAALLAHPAPVAPRLLAGDAAFLEHARPTRRSRARKYAAEQPTMPPPTIATSTAARQRIAAPRARRTRRYRCRDLARRSRSRRQTTCAVE